MDSSSGEDEDARARFASVAVQSDSIRAQAIALPPKRSRDLDSDAEAFVTTPFQLKVAQMLERKLDRWYEETQHLPPNSSIRKDGSDAATGVRLFSQVKPGTAFSTPLASTAADSSAGRRCSTDGRMPLHGTATAREEEDKVGNRRKSKASTTSSSSSEEDEDEEGFHQMLQSVAVDSQYVLSTAETSAKKAHQSYHEEQDREARTNQVEGGQSRQARRQTSPTEGSGPTPRPSHQVEVVETLPNPKREGKRRVHHDKHAPKPTPSRRKKEKSTRRS